MRPIYRIVIVVEDVELPETLIYDIRTMVSTFMPNANIVIREGDNVAYYIVEAEDGCTQTAASEGNDEVRRQAAYSGGDQREASA